MNSILQAIEKRRSQYHIDSKIPMEEKDFLEKVKKVVSLTPSAFNSESQRVYLLTGEANDALWDITLKELEKVAPSAESFEKTKVKIKGFAAGYGTFLFFEDMDIVKNLQEKFPLYKEHFANWSYQGIGMVELNLWNMLAEEGIGASLQHYNPLIDEAVKEKWNIPTSYRLDAQMPFGIILTPAEEKTKMDIDKKFQVIKK